MEENKGIKISLSTFFLILAILAIIVMGFFIYKLNNDKSIEIQKSTELQSQVNNLNDTVNSLQGKIDSISNTIASKDNSTSDIISSSDEVSNISEDQNKIQYDEEVSILELKNFNDVKLENYYNQYNGKLLKITGYVTVTGETDAFEGSVGLSDSGSNIEKTYVTGDTNESNLAKKVNDLKKGEKISIIGRLSEEKSIPLSLDIVSIINE